MSGKRKAEDDSSSSGDEEDGPLPKRIAAKSKEERAEFRWFNYWDAEKKRWRNVNDSDDDGAYWDHDLEKWVSEQ